MNILNSKFWFGQIVYLKHCPEQSGRMVVDINFEGSPDRVVYVLAFGSEKSLHYESEITTEVDQLKLINFNRIDS